MAKEFDNFFIDIGSKLIKEIAIPARSFKSYEPESITTLLIEPISVNELKNTFFSKKTNKCGGNVKLT